MSTLSIQVPFPVFQGRDGQPLKNGYVWIGEPNLNPQTNPVVAYYDAALTIVAPQPLRTLNGYVSRAGTPAQIYVDGVNFSILVQDSKGSMVYNFPDGSGISPNAAGVSFIGFKGQVGNVQDLADDDGSDWIGFDQAGAGAVATTVQAKLRESVSVKDFGAVGDGVTDDTAAIQAALNTGMDVIFPNPNYLISSSLLIGNQRVKGTGKLINRTQTIITPNGNFPAFVNIPGSFISFQIDGFFINYGNTTPTVALGNDEKYGFKFTGASQWPEFCKISNCTVKGGWGAWFDNTGTYESILEQIFSWNCRTAFYKKDGTTIKFDTCMAQGAVTPYHIDSTIAATLINCSADQCAVTVNSPFKTGCLFSGVRSLSILGWDSEANSITGDECSFMIFEGCSGTVSGFAGYQNTMSCAVGEEVYFFKNISASRIEFSGNRIARNVGDLVFNGSGGNCFTILAQTNSEILLSASEFLAATGGAPTNRYSAVGVGGNISYLKTGLDANIIADSVEATPISWTPALTGFTTTGIVSFPDAKFTKQGKLITFTVQVQASTISTTALTSFITGLPYTPANVGAASAITGSVTNPSAALIFTNGNIYLPTVAAWGNSLIITGSYFIN
jgi:hypothetical protein